MSYRYNTIDIIVGVGMCAIVFGALLFFVAANGTLQTVILANPAGIKPNTTMPDQKLTEADVADLVAFFDWVRHVDTNGWPPKPLGEGRP